MYRKATGPNDIYAETSTIIAEQDANFSNITI